MPNKAKGGKGGKKVRRGKKTQPTMVGGVVVQDRQVLKSDGPLQRYAQALKMLGDRRIQANVYNPETKVWEEKMIHVRGKFRKRVWINIGDFVLVSTRKFETGAGSPGSGSDDDEGDGKLPFGGDIIHKYEASEVKKLVKMGEFKLDDDDSEEYRDRFEIISDDEGENVLDDEKPKRPEVAAQRDFQMLPDSDDDSLDVDNMTKAELQSALEDL